MIKKFINRYIINQIESYFKDELYYLINDSLYQFDSNDFEIRIENNFLKTLFIKLKITRRKKAGVEEHFREDQISREYTYIAHSYIDLIINFIQIKEEIQKELSKDLYITNEYTYKTDFK